MKNNTSRVESLDWLRGLMAVSIMLYHLNLWMNPPISSETIIGRLGIYGVSIFFILSGLSMSIVYNNYINSIKDAYKFYVRRIFRIWPLLWISTLLTILPDIFATGVFKWKGFLLNITTLFGFIKPAAYIAVGAWSIGNEMVYYLLTPVFFIVYNHNLRLGNLLLTLTFILGNYFSFFLLDPAKGLSDQWNIYVNPFNNLFLYVLGISIFYNFKDLAINKLILNFLLVFSVLMFCYVPFSNDQINIVTGIGRIVFVLISFFIVLFFYKGDLRIPFFLKRILDNIGLSTYGIYILHPIIYQYAKITLPNIIMTNTLVVYFGISFFTIFFSFMLYQYIELQLIKIGKNVTK